MSSRGRQRSANTGSASNSPLNKSVGRLVGSTRSTSGSPSSRTRSGPTAPTGRGTRSVKDLKAPTPNKQTNKKPTAVKKQISVTTTPKSSPRSTSNSAATASAPATPVAPSAPALAPAGAPISAKRRSSAEERRRKTSRARPKFQDNPPAPEIVEIVSQRKQLAEKAKQESATSPDGQTKSDRLKAALQAAALMKEKAEAEAREAETEPQEETEETEEEIDDVEEDEVKKFKFHKNGVLLPKLF